MKSENTRGLAKKWQARIEAAEKVYAPYYDLIDETRESYTARRRGYLDRLRLSGAYNIFWSGIETQKPFLYFKQPKPCLERVNKSAGKAEILACRILERALAWNLESFDFDSVAKYARNDFLISGCGILWEQYRPEFREVAGPDGKNVRIKSSERVVSEYVDPRHFLADAEQVGIWEDVTWVAKKIYMSADDLKHNFGADGERLLPLMLSGREESRVRPFCVYEIWDKDSRRVMWWSPDYPDDFIRVVDDPLGVDGFFPCPKPIFATQSNDSLIPVPDYLMIKADLDELSGVIERMRLTMQALKVTGGYDSAFSNLADILNKDVTLVAIADFERLKNSGGLKGVVDFMPIEQYITALQALAARRDDIIEHIYQVTGISDIMRGSSKAGDTATAVTKKTNFGTLRNQDRQNDMQRFIRDLYRLKAEIICEQFSLEQLRAFVPPAEAADRQLADEALRLLKEDKMRNMILSVETDAVFDQELETQKTLETTQNICTMISTAFQTVSMQPALLPLYRQMIEAVAATMPRSRPFEAVIEQVFSKVEQELNKPDPKPQPPQPTIEEQIKIQKMKNEYEIDKEKNLLEKIRLMQAGGS